MAAGSVTALDITETLDDDTGTLIGHVSVEYHSQWS